MISSAGHDADFDTTLARNRTLSGHAMDLHQVESVVCQMSGDVVSSAMLAQRPHYFASTSVMLSDVEISAMFEQITAIEKVIQQAEFVDVAAGRSEPLMCAVQPATQGVFMAYDFHLTPQGPRLIEINSNGGGAYIVNALEYAAGLSSGGAERAMFEMFMQEWTLAGRRGTPQTVAIVDDNPTQQFHFPDMCLAAASLAREGLQVQIVDACELFFQQGRLRANGVAIDLVYNRLTDFALSHGHHAVLRSALLDDAVVVTPAPRHHALYADKRNLTLLSDQEVLASWGVAKVLRQTLTQLPQSVIVTPDNADELWAARRAYFFKPHAGFGGRGAFRGAKLTRKTWQHITQSGYVAQAFVAPPLRRITCAAEPVLLKYDIRVYTYGAKPLLLAARLYQGQTTNLQTDYGGLAPVQILESHPMAFPGRHPGA
ncbi:MAG: hypothetical protein ACFHXK_16160 [bacterium]